MILDSDYLLPVFQIYLKMKALTLRYAMVTLLQPTWRGDCVDDLSIIHSTYSHLIL